MRRKRKQSYGLFSVGKQSYGLFSVGKQSYGLLRSKKLALLQSNKLVLLRSNKFTLFLAFVIFLFSSLLFLTRSGIFNVKAVEVESEKVICSDPNQLRDTAKILGENIIFLNSSKIKNDLKKNFLCLKDLEIVRYLPNKVMLKVIGREPVAILVSVKSEDTHTDILEKFTQTMATPSAEATASADFNFSQEELGENFLVDSEGIIYAKNVEQLNTPRVYVSEQKLALGQKIQEDLLGDTLKILNKVKIFGLEIKETKIYSENLLLINAMPRIIFKLGDNIDTQLASLQLILNKAKINKENVEFIDLRFDKPIVRFAPKKNGQR